LWQDFLSATNEETEGQAFSGLKHVDKKTGAVYVYKCESYWDKELKAPRNRQVYVGKEDPKTHEIIPAAPKKAKPAEGPHGAAHGREALHPVPRPRLH